jgi:penicillin-binding protein 2
MCVVENSGRFGGTYAAPIVGLMIEKYLKDSITDKARLARVEQLSNLNLIPARVYIELKRQDSLMHAKDSAYLILKGYLKIAKDSLGIDEGDEEEGLDKMKADDKLGKKEKPAKDSSNKKMMIKSEAILPDEKKKPETKDTVNTP